MPTPVTVPMSSWVVPDTTPESEAVHLKLAPDRQGPGPGGARRPVRERAGQTGHRAVADDHVAHRHVGQRLVTGVGHHVTQRRGAIGQRRCRRRSVSCVAVAVALSDRDRRRRRPEPEVQGLVLLAGQAARHWSHCRSRSRSPSCPDRSTSAPARPGRSSSRCA